MNFHSYPPKLARLCNEALDQSLTEGEREAMIAAAARKVEELFGLCRKLFVSEFQLLGWRSQ
jgi:GTP cyclohydrolase I